MSKMSNFFGAAAIALTSAGAVQAEPADERSLLHLLAALDSPGHSQSMLTEQPSGQARSFTTLGDDSQCRIALSATENQTIMRPTADCACDETIGTPHNARITGGQIERISNSGALVQSLISAGIAFETTSRITFVPRQGCERSGGGNNTPSTGGNNGFGGGCGGGGCGGNGNGGTGGTGGGSPTGGGGNSPPGPGFN